MACLVGGVGMYLCLLAGYKCQQPLDTDMVRLSAAKSSGRLGAQCVCNTVFLCNWWPCHALRTARAEFTSINCRLDQTVLI